MTVTSILAWKSETGEKYSILLVEDRIELCEFDSNDEEWKTKEVLDNIDEIESFGIPPGYSA